MDRRVMVDKLERLRRCVQRIEPKRPATLVALAPAVTAGAGHVLPDGVW